MKEELVQEGDDSQTEGSVEDVIGANDTSSEAYLGESPKPANRNLVVLGVVLLAAVGFWFLRSRNGPQAAEAAQGDTAKATIDQFLSDGGRNMKLMQDLIRNTEKVVARFKEFPSTRQVPLSDLRTNPFRFAAAVQGEDDAAASARTQRDAERKQVLATLGQLKLQSIVYGDSRRACLVNNELYKEGDRVQGLLIEKINPGSIVVRGQSLRFELRMQK